MFYEVTSMLVKYLIIFQVSFLVDSVHSVQFIVVRDRSYPRSELHWSSTARDICTKGKS